MSFENYLSGRNSSWAAVEVFESYSMALSSACSERMGSSKKFFLGKNFPCHARDGGRFAAPEQPHFISAPKKSRATSMIYRFTSLLQIKCV